MHDVVSATFVGPIPDCMLHFCTACTLLVCAKPTRQKESARGACFAFLACCFFFFPCVLLKAPQQNRAKAPQPSPERAPTKSRKGPNQVPKGPPTVRKHPRFRLESSEAMPNLAFCTSRLFELAVPCFLSPAAFATCYAILVSTE